MFIYSRYVNCFKRLFEKLLECNLNGFCFRSKKRFFLLGFEGLVLESLDILFYMFI